MNSKNKRMENIMKVTKIVREHIEDKIEKLYQPALDKIDDELKSLNRQVDEEQDKIKDKTKKVVVDFLKKEGFIPYNDDLGFSLYLY
jgi:ABC-type Zn2+ transport system substrate-binding protein/surface adhesin